MKSMKFNDFDFPRDRNYKYGMAALAFIVVWSLLSILFQGDPEPRTRPIVKPQAATEVIEEPENLTSDAEHLKAIHQDLLERELPSANDIRDEKPKQPRDTGVHIK